MIKTCDRGHTSLDAANWRCPWCQSERLRARVEELEAAIRDLRTAALVEDWHTFDATIDAAMREGKND